MASSNLGWVMPMINTALVKTAMNSFALLLEASIRERCLDLTSSPTSVRDCLKILEKLADETIVLTLQQVTTAGRSVKRRNGVSVKHEQAQWAEIATQAMLEMSRCCHELAKSIPANNLSLPFWLLAICRFQQQFYGIMPVIEMVISSSIRVDERKSSSYWQSFGLLQHYGHAKPTTTRRLTINPKLLHHIVMPFPFQSLRCPLSELSTPMLIELTQYVLSAQCKDECKQDNDITTLTQLFSVLQTRDNITEDHLESLLATSMHHPDTRLWSNSNERVQRHRQALVHCVLNGLSACRGFRDFTPRNAYAIVFAHLHEIDVWFGDEECLIYQYYQTLTSDHKVRLLLDYCACYQNESIAQYPQLSQVLGIKDHTHDNHERDVVRLFHYFIHSYFIEGESDVDRVERVFLPTPEKLTQLFNLVGMYPVLREHVFSYFEAWCRHCCNDTNEEDTLITLINGLVQEGAVEQFSHYLIATPAWVDCPDVVEALLTHSFIANYMVVECKAQNNPNQLGNSLYLLCCGALAKQEDGDLLRSVDKISSPLCRALLFHPTLANRVLSSHVLREYCIQRNLNTPQTIKIIEVHDWTPESLAQACIASRCDDVQWAMLIKLNQYVPERIHTQEQIDTLQVILPVLKRVPRLFNTFIEHNQTALARCPAQLLDQVVRSHPEPIVLRTIEGQFRSHARLFSLLQLRPEQTNSVSPATGKLICALSQNETLKAQCNASLLLTTVRQALAGQQVLSQHLVDALLIPALGKKSHADSGNEKTNEMRYLYSHFPHSAILFELFCFDPAYSLYVDMSLLKNMLSSSLNDDEGKIDEAYDISMKIKCLSNVQFLKKFSYDELLSLVKIATAYGYSACQSLFFVLLSKRVHGKQSERELKKNVDHFMAHVPKSGQKTALLVMFDYLLRLAKNKNLLKETQSEAYAMKLLELCHSHPLMGYFERLLHAQNALQLLLHPELTLELYDFLLHHIVADKPYFSLDFVVDLCQADAQHTMEKCRSLFSLVTKKWPSFHPYLTFAENEKSAGSTASGQSQRLLVARLVATIYFKLDAQHLGGVANFCRMRRIVLPHLTHPRGSGVLSADYVSQLAILITTSEPMTVEQYQDWLKNEPSANTEVVKGLYPINEMVVEDLVFILRDYRLLSDENQAFFLEKLATSEYLQSIEQVTSYFEQFHFKKDRYIKALNKFDATSFTRRNGESRFRQFGTIRTVRSPHCGIAKDLIEKLSLIMLEYLADKPQSQIERIPLSVYKNYMQQYQKLLHDHLDGVPVETVTEDNIVYINFLFYQRIELATEIVEQIQQRARGTHGVVFYPDSFDIMDPINNKKRIYRLTPEDNQMLKHKFLAMSITLEQ